MDAPPGAHSNSYAHRRMFPATDGVPSCSTSSSSSPVSVSSWRQSRMRLPAIACEAAMILDYALAAVVMLGVLAYLVYALIRPERF